MQFVSDILPRYHHTLICIIESSPLCEWFELLFCCFGKVFQAPDLFQPVRCLIPHVVLKHLEPSLVVLDLIQIWMTVWVHLALDRCEAFDLNCLVEKGGVGGTQMIAEIWILVMKICWMKDLQVKCHES